ncbi:MAG: GT4 family glycosyltransferase PelF [Spirochaetales bacterium]|nr:GT4 family glycosyltransferase PelF [Spirochaetales bacterium]
MDDVCFILEGTYPFIGGGVSVWVQNLLESMPDINFSILALSPKIGKPKKYKYVLPPNVKNLLEVFLYTAIIPKQPCPMEHKKDVFWRKFYDFLSGKDESYGSHFAELLPMLIDPKQRVVSSYELLYSEESHKITEKLYEQKKGMCSFFDFFWTWRSMLLILIQTLHMEIPPARLYHATSTGYAGLVGVIAKIKYNRPLVLSEHGIYTNERRIEINQATWIQKDERSRVYIQKSQGMLKDLWMDHFRRLGQATYDLCDDIITLFEGNKKLAVEFGANFDRITIIPNGVRVEQYGTQRGTPKPDPSTFIVGLVGRVVPIKDIKMFIKVCKIVTNWVPNCLFHVIGPFEEDADYVQECLELVEILGLEEKCIFTGPKNLVKDKTYTTLDIMALTSISEGQPLTILEAMCVGVACVTTDVGACSELLYGRTEEDKALGKCGFVVPIGDVDRFAESCIRILKDDTLRENMKRIGIERIDKYYKQERIIQLYKSVYLKYVKS